MNQQKANPQCQHHWIPIEWVAGKRVYQGDTCYVDWNSNIINAHYLRATKLYCPLCGGKVSIPGDESDK